MGYFAGRGIMPAPVLALSFAWNANPGGDNVTKYSLYSGSSPGTYSGHVDVGLVTTYSIPRPGSTTYYALTATNANGESGYSSELHYP